MFLLRLVRIIWEGVFFVVNLMVLVVVLLGLILWDLGVRVFLLMMVGWLLFFIIDDIIIMVLLVLFWIVSFMIVLIEFVLFGMVVIVIILGVFDVGVLMLFCMVFDGLELVVGRNFFFVVDEGVMELFGVFVDLFGIIVKMKVLMMVVFVVLRISVLCWFGFCCGLELGF